MKMMNKVCALVLSVALCAGMAAPAFAYGGEPVEEVEQPVQTSTTDEEDAVTVTDEENGALTPEGNLTLVDDYHTSYSDGSGQQFITLVSKSGNTFYLVIDRNSKGAQTVHFMNLVDEADLLALKEEDLQRVGMRQIQGNVSDGCCRLRKNIQMILMPPSGGIFVAKAVMMLAATRLIALHKNKGMTIAACLKNRTDYIENPDKTEQGQYVSSYACGTLTADEEFKLCSFYGEAFRFVCKFR